jgi:arginyl-tRNA--protein-N-Asp/Glu arginylyltransferase
MACRSLADSRWTGFRPNRSQRRIWTRNQDVQDPDDRSGHSRTSTLIYSPATSRGPPYRRGAWTRRSPDSYWSFITSRWNARRGCAEFRRDQAIAGSSRCGPTIWMMDSQPSTPSSTRLQDRARTRRLRDPVANRRSVKRLGLKWLYLGYWVEHCHKMTYKARFTPHEMFVTERWHWAQSES